MEPRWGVIRFLFGFCILTIAIFFMCNLAASVWEVFRENNIAFLKHINDIGDTQAGFNNEMKGVLGIGILGIIILGAIRILSAFTRNGDR